MNFAMNFLFYILFIVIHCTLQPLHLHIDNIELISFMKYVHMYFFVRTNDFGSIKIMTWVITSSIQNFVGEILSLSPDIFI